MPILHIHITGASGSGVTTLGRALATAIGIPAHDTDDYYWLPSDPPFHAKRAIPDRLRLMHEVFVPRAGWILSGSLDGWGDPLIPYFDAVIFLQTETAVRLARLREREAKTFGADAIAPGGHSHAHVEDFLAWAAQYDDAFTTGRNLVRHEAWLKRLPCPVLRLDGGMPLQALVANAIAFIQQSHRV